jgi:hypothetical protein
MVRPPSFIVSAALAREACQAGASPAAMPASVHTPSANSSTGTLSLISVSDGSVKGGISATMASTIDSASSVPSSPPARASTTLSTRS